MYARRLLFILPICLFVGVVYGQKNKKKRSITNEIETFINDSEGKNQIHEGDLIIALIDSARAKYITRIARTNTKKQPLQLVFELGDLTQIFTSLLVHELAIQGKLDFHKSINDLLPRAFRSDYFRDVTLQDCLSHTTGLPRIPNNLGAKQIDHNQPFEYYDASDLAEFIQNWTPSDKEKVYRYSLIGYELVDILLQHQFNKSFGQMVQEVLVPAYGFETLTAGYVEIVQGKNKVGNHVEPMRFASFLSSSGLKGSMNDMARLLVDPLCNTRPAFLAALQEITTTGIDQSVGIASGWHQYHVNRHHSFYLHKGMTKGFSSFMAYYPERGTGVVILSSIKVNLGPMGYYIMGNLNNEWKK